MIKQLLLVASLVGCGQMEPDDSIYKRPLTPMVVDARLKDLTAEFKDICKQRNLEQCLTNFKHLRSVEMVSDEVLNPEQDKTKNPRVGLCTMWNATQISPPVARIQIHERYADEPVILKAIMFHELGHCVLDLGHTEGSWVNFRIMNPWIYGEVVYNRYWRTLVDDEFASALQLDEGSVDDDNHDVIRY